MDAKDCFYTTLSDELCDSGALKPKLNDEIIEVGIRFLETQTNLDIVEQEFKRCPSKQVGENRRTLLFENELYYRRIMSMIYS